MKGSTRLSCELGVRNWILVVLFAAVPHFALAQHKNGSPAPTPHASATPHTSAPATQQHSMQGHSSMGARTHTAGPGSMGSHGPSNMSNPHGSPNTMHGGTNANSRPGTANSHVVGNAAGHTGNAMAWLRTTDPPGTWR